MQITEKLVSHNFTKSLIKRDIKFIVIHDTGNPNRGADADAHYRYFNTPGRNASAHYFVDDKKILRIIKDNDIAWHAGDGKGKYGITNSNSIGIEMCVNEGYDRLQMKKNTLSLVAQLMQQHNVSLNNVVRHYDASRKICPASMRDNNWTEWHEFKEALNDIVSPKDIPGMVKIEYKGRTLLIPGVMQDNKNYVAVRDLLESMGYTVGWDNVKKIVLVK